MVEFVKVETTVLSCQVRDVAMFTDKPSVDVSLKARSGDALLSGRFWPFAGVVHLRDLRDLRELMEQYIRGTGECVQEFSLTAVNGSDRDEISFAVVHCDRNIDCADKAKLFSENFLTPARSRRIAPGGFVYVPFFAYKGENMECSVIAEYRDAQGYRSRTQCVGCFAGEKADSDKVYVGVVSASEVEQFCTEDDGTPAQLLSMEIRCGARAMTVFIDTSLADMPCFFFRNAFNAPDVAYIPAVTTAKTTTERSVAVMLETSVHYDATSKRTFEVQSDGMTQGECALAEQMLTSHDVRIQRAGEHEREFDNLVPVLVSDYTCEMADRPEQPNKVKFSWQFAENGIALSVTQSDSIFTEQYNITFK